MRFSEQQIRASVAEARFAELADVLLACGGVRLGRGFGRECLKFGKRPFIVLDAPTLVFFTGSVAPGLLQALPLARPWNPRNGRRPKESWIATLPHDVESIGTLTMIAYDWVRSRGG